MATNSVSVLAPNGRRQTVKCTPNTTIMQIIEEVCKKQGFNPEDHDVKHHKKIMDTTTTFRFSGLPNNAQLELVAAVKTRLDSEITLAVDLESGSRLVGNFLPDETLWGVLKELCPDEAKLDQNPLIIYTRREIYGSELEKTTLRSLGLRGGRAMVRLVHRSPNEVKTQANVSAALPAKPVEEKPYHRTLKTDPQPLSQETESVSQSSKPAPLQKKPEVDLLKLAREKRKLPESPAKSLENDVKSPKIKSAAEKEEVMEVDLEDSSSTNLRPEPPPEEFIFLGARNAMLFSLETAQAISSDDLPDDFFELTIDDAKKILKGIRMKRHGMENGSLMTAAMRNLEESKKQLRQLNKYKKSVIRVQFPDRTILQGIFTPTETVKDVLNFVSEYLQDRSVQIYLYTTPPKCVLSEADSLVEVGCVPGALLHLGSATSEKEVHLKSELRDKFTTNSMASLAASQTRRQTTRATPDEASDNMELEEIVDEVSDLNAPGPSSAPTSCERKVVKSTEKVPKWFKATK